jgi:hypothetical protein
MSAYHIAAHDISTQPSLEVSVARATRWLTFATIALVACGLLSVYANYVLGHDWVFGLVRKFDLDREMNVPSWFSSALLFLAALLLMCVGGLTRREGDRFSRHWTILGWTFLLLSLDETAGLHGLLSQPLRRSLDLSGMLHYAWVVPVGLAVLAFAAAYLRFLWNLPPRIRLHIAAAGIIYVSGALGGELVEGILTTTRGIDLVFALSTVVEETLEMAGLLVFVQALLRFIALRWGGVRMAVQA